MVCGEKKSNIMTNIHKFIRNIASLSMWFGITLLFSVVIRIYIFEPVKVNGQSMYPTYEHNELVFMEKLSHHFNDYKRFDVVVFYDGSEFLIKRIIGLPGEKIYINDNGEIFIDDILLDENYGNDIIDFSGLADSAITLDEDEYFVLGDNRNNSRDSRSFGPVNETLITGKILFHK